MNFKDKIWVEKYRPKTLEDLIIPDRIYNKFKDSEVNNHTLLHGTAGMGKTSIAKILAKDTAYMFVNCSLESGVDEVRNKVINFCSSLSLVGGNAKEKYVILDEFDGASEQYFKAMRGVMEKFAATTRFIATCNYIDKIPDNVRSRFDKIDFNFPKEEEKDLKLKYMKRVNMICKNEGITIDKGDIVKLVQRFFPDMRATITFLQSKYSEGKTTITSSDIDSYSGGNTDFYNMLLEEDSYIKIYQSAFKNYVNNEDKAFAELGTDFITYLITRGLDENKIADILEATAEHTYQAKFVIDKFVTLAALLSVIFKIIKSNG